MKPVILLASGIDFDLANPSPDQIDIEDIAHSLSHICRFTGHVHAKNKPMKAHESVLVFSSGTTVHATQSPSRMPYNPQGLEPVSIVKKQDTPGRLAGGRDATISARPGRKQAHLQEATGYPRSVIRFPSVSMGAHPTQKPVALMEYLVRTYTNLGDTVLDNCMGSGTTGVACMRTGRRFIGMEMNAGYFEIARQRIAKAAPANDNTPATGDLFGGAA